MTPEDRQFLKAAFQAVVDAPLYVNDTRYVALGEAARGEDPVERLAREIEFSAGESLQFVTGFRGTGKTTELKRLGLRLHDEGYDVAYVDMDATLRVGNNQFLTRDQFFDALLLGFNQPIRHNRLEYDWAGIRLADDPGFSTQETVLIVDSLEHVRTTSTKELAHAAIADLLVQYASELRIRGLHVVCTVPPDLKLDAKMAAAIRLAGIIQSVPAVRVRSERGFPSWPGIEALEALLGARFDTMRLLGSRDLVLKVITHSGGNPRDLLRLVGEIIRRARTLPVSAEVVENAIGFFQSEFMVSAGSSIVPLARIAETHELALAGPESIADVARWSDAHLVLEYRDGREWYDVHPLVRNTVLERARALAKAADSVPPPDPASSRPSHAIAAHAASVVLTPEMCLTIIVENYRALSHVRWTLPRGVSALVGPNGSGKTTLLDIPELLRHALQYDVTRAIDARGGPGNLRNARADRNAPVILGAALDDLVWRLDLSPKGAFTTPLHGERATVGEATVFDRTAPIPGLALRPDDARPLLARFAELPEGGGLQPLVNLLAGYRLYQTYDLANIRVNGSQVSSDEHLHPDGRNVFSVLRNWRDRMETRPRWEFVIESLKAAFPDTFDDLDFEMAGQTVSGRIVAPQPDLRISTYFAATGWLVALLHLTAVASTDPAGAVAIDEVENGLHPYAIRQIIEAMRSWAAQTGISIVLATHSPVVIDQFKDEPSHLFVMEPGRPEAPLQLDKLHDPEWLAHFSLGDLYAHDEFGAQNKDGEQRE
ncbi:AAA family ATPase [Polyangium jinanense]|uniref:AAA family ATPase n=1 Tax=Polyangium jinanense TaxID=2829994 RepID=A0A9X3XDY3_9BACT|nr:AAA family ATPase [Polyangium jinanense]MDC3988482.1 AAA family ATPase [Polyangium jinanense]